MPRPLVIVITGATASGKTAVAVEVARSLGTEIISADSRQIYRGMPITTAVPTAAERQGVKHHLLECLEVEQTYSAAQFEADALALLPGIFARCNDVAVVCGGTMLYVDALLNGIDTMPTISETARQRVVDLRQQHGMEGLLALLQITDPKHFEDLGQQGRTNPRRVMHALEVSMQAGVPYSSLLTGQRRQRPFNALKVAIDWPRDQLFARINSRVDRMVADGMEAEALQLYPKRGLPALDTVGLREWFDYFGGKTDRATAIARIARNTRVFAKKQLTWLRRPGAETYWLSPPQALV